VHWKLSEAVLRTALRRARRTIAAVPLVAVAVGCLAFALPAVAFVSGDRLAPLFTAAAADPTLARALAATAVGPTFVVGVALGALAPDHGMVGPQLSVAPIRSRTWFTSLTLVPTALLAAAVALPLLVASAAATAETRPGRVLSVLVAAALLATAAFGAAAATLVAASASRLRYGLLGGALAAAWAGIGASYGTPLLGLGAALARDVGASGTAEIFRDTAVCAVFAAAALGCWGAAHGRVDRRRCSGAARVRLVVAGGVRRSTASAAVARLVRHRQIRRHLALALVCGVAAAAGARIVGAGGAAASYLPLIAALVAAAALPPAEVALRRDGPWLARAAPVRLATLARAGASGAVLAAVGTVVATLVFAAPVAALEPAAWPLAETSAALVVAAAVVGGSVVPWRPDHVVDQVGSYIVVGAAAAALSLLVGRLTADAAAVGVPEALTAALAANGCVAAAVAIAGVIER